MRGASYSNFKLKIGFQALWGGNMYFSLLSQRNEDMKLKFTSTSNQLLKHLALSAATPAELVQKAMGTVNFPSVSMSSFIIFFAAFNGVEPLAMTPSISKRIPKLTCKKIQDVHVTSFKDTVEIWQNPHAWLILNTTRWVHILELPQSTGIEWYKMFGS